MNVCQSLWAVPDKLLKTLIFAHPRHARLPGTGACVISRATLAEPVYEGHGKDA